MKLAFDLGHYEIAKQLVDFGVNTTNLDDTYDLASLDDLAASEQEQRQSPLITLHLMANHPAVPREQEQEQEQQQVQEKIFQ